MVMEAFLFGVTVAIAIGPIALLIINASVTRGLLAGLACGMGAALADFCFALAAFHSGAALVQALEQHAAAIAAGGSALLAILGMALIAGAVRRKDSATTTVRYSIGLKETWLLTITNPFAITMFIAWISRFPGSPDFATRNILAVAVFAGSLLIQGALAAGGLLLRPFFARQRVLLACNLLSGAGIAAFGLLGLVRLM